MSDINQRLRQVQAFNVEVNQTNQPSAFGQGVVNVEYHSPDTVIWRENGHWQQCFNGLEFTNVYRWSLLADSSLGLEHLRYGDENPVQLVKLEKSASGLWLSKQSHICGEDRYSLEMTINDKNLSLMWQIKGPNKDQLSTVSYS